MEMDWIAPKKVALGARGEAPPSVVDNDQAAKETSNITVTVT
jgi:hypothetical protein